VSTARPAAGSAARSCRSCRSARSGRGAVARAKTACPPADTRAVRRATPGGSQQRWCRATRSSRTLRAWLRPAPYKEVEPCRRHSPEQIIRELREADRLLDEGQEVAVVAKQLEVTGQTLQRWGGSTAA